MFKQARLQGTGSMEGFPPFRSIPKNDLAVWVRAKWALCFVALSREVDFPNPKFGFQNQHQEFFNYRIIIINQSSFDFPFLLAGEPRLECTNTPLVSEDRKSRNQPAKLSRRKIGEVIEFGSSCNASDNR